MENFDKEAVDMVAKLNAKFGNDLLKVVAKQDSNLVMSSYSANSVLNMILQGAAGQTAVEMKAGLGLSDEKALELTKSGFKNALSLLKSNENFTLHAANR